MLIRGNPLRRMDRAFIEQLVEERIDEGQEFDYKRKLPGNTVPEKHEFCRDVCAFANADGGVLIYGVDAPKDRPWQLCGLDDFNADEEMLRLGQVIRDNVEPAQMPKVEFLPIAAKSDGKPLLLVGVPRSLSAPHRVRGENLNFRKRIGNMNLAMNIQELKRAFVEAESWVQEATEQWNERVAILESGEAEPRISGQPMLALSVSPLGRPDGSIDVPVLRREWGDTPAGWPVGATVDRRANIMGWQLHAQWKGGGFNANLNVQLYRNGGFEIALPLHRYVVRPQGPPMLAGDELEVMLRLRLDSAIRFLTTLGVSPPYVLNGAILNASQYGLALTRRATPFHEPELFQRSRIVFPSIVIDSEEAEVVARETFRSFCNMVWQAAGAEQSPHWTEEGAWKIDIKQYQAHGLD